MLAGRAHSVSRVAISVARSKLSHSTIQYPASTSSLSAYGPSVTTGAPCWIRIRRARAGPVSPRVSTSSPDSASSRLNDSMNVPSAAKSAPVQPGSPAAGLPAIAS